MREPNALISTDALARDLSGGDLLVFDCTTYLEPPPPGSDDPYIAVPGRSSFETGHIPGVDFLDLQGEFSDNTTRLRFMMPPVEQLEAAFGRPWHRRGYSRRALQHRHHDVGDAVLVDAEGARLRWCCGARWRFRQMAG